jgi:hypothetical protein
VKVEGQKHLLRTGMPVIVFRCCALCKVQRQASSGVIASKRHLSIYTLALHSMDTLTLRRDTARHRKASMQPAHIPGA